MADQWGPPPPPSNQQPPGSEAPPQGGAPQQPGWGPPTQPSTRPPRQPRQFTVTKIAIGVAAGIALFLVGCIVLLAVLLSSSSSGDKKAAAPAATEGPTSPPWDTGTAPTDSSPDVTQPPAAAPSELAIGDTGSFTSDEGDADITITKVQTATRDPAPYGDRPSHGWFVVFHVKAIGTRGSYDVNSFDFYVKSSNGYHTEDPEYLDSWGPSLESGTLHSGEHLSGTIVYDAPTKHGKLVYSPNLDSEPLASWTF